jgi:UDP-galactopyranose mutase
LPSSFGNNDEVPDCGIKENPCWRGIEVAPREDHIPFYEKGKRMTELAECRNLVVGAGLWGTVLAERIASILGEPVLVIDRRNHVGGNCWSRIHPQTDIECHIYGTHIFHTRKAEVWKYLNLFTEFNSYRHKVLTEHAGRWYPMPIGLGTVNAFYGLSLKPFEMENFIRDETVRENIGTPRNLEEKAISLIGRTLYEAFIKGYTQKQWNKSPADLPADIITRLPVRSSYNFDYFDDPWQGLPLCGYYGLFEKMLTHKNISLCLGIDYKDIAGSVSANCRVFYSGSLDEFFDYRLGSLEWRSLRFEEELLSCADYQGTAVMNQADASVPFTRTHEYRHLHPERQYTKKNTVIVREYPQDFTRGMERYYPVNTPSNQKLLREYQKLAKEVAPYITFGGRLGSYRYWDMDATVEQALAVFKKLEPRQ